jgi:hypothetical protein
MTLQRTSQGRQYASLAVHLAVTTHAMSRHNRASSFVFSQPHKNNIQGPSSLEWPTTPGPLAPLCVSAPHQQQQHVPCHHLVVGHQAQRQEKQQATNAHKQWRRQATDAHKAIVNKWRTRLLGAIVPRPPSSVRPTICLHTPGQEFCLHADDAQAIPTM